MRFYVSVFVLICKGGHGGIPNTDRHRPEWAWDHSESGQEPDPDSYHRTQYRKGTLETPCPIVNFHNSLLGKPSKIHVFPLHPR